MIMSDINERREKGKSLAAKLLDGVPPPAKMPKKFVDYTLEHVFGDVWQDDSMSLEERSLVTCTMLVVLNREAEMRVHFRGAYNLGIPKEKIEGMIIHAAHYGGWPVAASAFRILTEAWPED
jgi:4-carboxymuconolactone decarboxylase